MKIQTEQNKPHRKWRSIAQEFTVSFTIIISSVTIVYIGKEIKSIRDGFKYIHWMSLYLTGHITHGHAINIRVH